MKHSLARVIPVLFILLFQAPLLLAQNNNASAQEPAVAVDSTAVPIIPYAVTEISQGANNTILLVQQAGSSRITEGELSKMKAEADSFFAEVDPFLADTAFLDLSDLNNRELEKAESRVNVFLNQISTSQNRLNLVYNGLEDDIIALDEAKKKWQLTREQTGDKKVPAELLGRIDVTVITIDSVADILQEDMREILLIQDRILDRTNKLLALKNGLQKASLALSKNLLVRDMPGFFRDLLNISDPGLVPAHISAIRNVYKSDMDVFKDEFSGHFTFIIVFFIFLTGFLYWFRINHSKVISGERVELNEIQLTLVRSPLLLAIFIASTLFFLGYKDLPFTIRAITILIMITPLGVLAIRFFGLKVRAWVIWLTTVFILTISYELLFSPDILQRILLLILSVINLVMFGRALYLFSSFQLPVNKGWLNMIRNVLIAFLLLLFVSIIANFIGASRLAEFFTLIPVRITFNLLIIMTLIRLVDFVLYLLLGSKLMLRLNVIADFFDVIHRRVSQLVRLGLWIFFLVRVLRILRINQGLFGWWTKFFTTTKKIGDAELSLESIAIFVFVIWLSIFLAKVVRYVLEKDVFVRISSSKGTPGTIILLVRIAMITGGFLLAARAAGMALTNLSIVLGAFSVGIGFGLQNIFNNMVSGFILAVERPISVGDTVEVGTIMGNVTNIGLRASKVRSFDGAEMIVPNGMLISDVLTNWTLSDAFRRMDIRVGVAYGTDPNTVVDILDEAAREHEKVMKHPEPASYFIEFGESSLDFRLLAWVNLEDRLRVESELKTTINEKLKKAGLEIPFPQRDLHIRSDATKPGPGDQK